MEFSIKRHNIIFVVVPCPTGTNCLVGRLFEWLTALCCWDAVVAVGGDESYRVTHCQLEPGTAERSGVQYSGAVERDSSRNRRQWRQWCGAQSPPELGELCQETSSG